MLESPAAYQELLRELVLNALADGEWHDTLHIFEGACSNGYVVPPRDIKNQLVIMLYNNELESRLKTCCIRMYRLSQGGQ